MADVGTLNLQIHADSEEAKTGLENLEGALRRVKEACSEMKLGSAATQIKKIVTVIKENVDETTLSKLNQFSEAISKLNGLGNININIKAADKIKNTLESIEAGRQSVEGISQSSDKMTQAISDGFSSASSDIRKATEEYDEMKERMSEPTDIEKNVAESIEKSIGGIDYSKININEFIADPLTAMMERYRNTGSAADDFRDKLDASIPVLKNYRDTVLSLESNRDIAGFSKQTGDQLLASIKHASDDARSNISESTESMNKDLEGTQQAIVDVAEGTGTVSRNWSDLATRIKYADEYAQHFKETVAQSTEEYQSMRAGQEKVEEHFNDPPKSYSMQETNVMADNLTQLDLLKSKLRDAEEQYNKFVNTLGASSTKAITAGLKVSDLRDKIWQYTDALKNANNESSVNGMDKVTEYMDSSKVELLTEKYNAMQTALASDIQSGRIDAQTAIDRALQMKNLGDQIENLKEQEEDAEGSTYGLRSALDSLKNGVKNLSFVKLISQFGRIAKYRFLRSVIREITSGFSEGVENVYWYSKTVGTSFSSSMDSAASSLAQFKNSIGAAASPLLESLIPALQSLISWLITGINYVNQFFSLLNGQTTWTKALATAVDAYTDSTNKTKKATGTLKELLADWDELNIIQSSSSGSGSGAGITVDYSSMFEQTSEYEDWIKDIANYVKDHMEDILDLVKAIGIAILAWKISSAFSGVLSDLLKITAGATLMVTGIKLSYNAGFEAGENGGFDGETILTAAAGTLATAVGGSIITNTAGLGSGVGFAVGLVAGLVATVVGYIEGMEDLKDKMKWGNITWTQEQLHEYVQSLFTFDVKAEIDILDSLIKDQETAKNNLNSKIDDFSKSLHSATVKLRVKNDSSAIADAGEKAAAVVDEISAYLETNNKSIQALLETVPIVDESGIDMSGDILGNIQIADTNLQEWFNSQGEKIAKWIDEGTKTGWKNNEAEMALALMSHTQDILTKAEENRVLNQFKLDAKGGLAMLSRDNVKEALTYTQELLEEYKNDAIQAYNNTITDLRYRADLARGANLIDDANTYDELADQFESGYTEAIEEKMATSEEILRKEWIEALKRVYGGDITSQFDFLTDFDDLPLGGLFGSYVDPATEFAQRLKEAKAGNNIEEAKAALTDYLKYLVEQVDPNHIALDASNLFDFNALDFASDEGFNKMISFLTNNVGDEWTKELLKIEEETEKVVGKTKEAIESAVETDAPVIDEGNLVPSGNFFKPLRERLSELAEEADKQNPVNVPVTVEPRPVVDLSGMSEIAQQVNREIQAAAESGSLSEGTLKYLSETYNMNLEGIINQINPYAQSEDTVAKLNEIIDAINKANGTNFKLPGFDDNDWSASLNSAAGDIKGFVDEVDNQLARLDGAGFTFSGDVTTGGSFTVKPVKTLKMMATGGFPKSGDLVMANENGNIEMMGRMGSKAVVANNQQIVSGISAGVENANSGMESRMGNIENMLSRILSKQFVATAVPSASWGRHNAQSNNQYSKVTGY